VREAVFNMLTSMDAVTGTAVVDLFAGSGALGIEALSRGASTATFVDHDRSAIEAIRANLDVLGDDGAGGRVVQADALGWVRRLGGARVDVVFADPPYSWAEWAALLGPLETATDLVVAETGTDLDAGPGWETVRSRRYGTTVISVLRPLPTSGRRPVAGPRPAYDQPGGGV
jgi:16S rRNA (guanine966-N2)-methyltransferase